MPSMPSMWTCISPLTNCFSPAQHCFSPSCLPTPARTRDPTRLPGPPPIIPEDDVLHLPEDDELLLGPASPSIAAGDQEQPLEAPLHPPSQNGGNGGAGSSMCSPPPPFSSFSSAPPFATTSGTGEWDDALLHSNSSSGTLGDGYPGMPLVHLPFPPSISPTVYQLPGRPASLDAGSRAAVGSSGGSLPRMGSSQSNPQTDPSQLQLQRVSAAGPPSVGRRPTFPYLTPTASSTNLLDLSTTSLSTARESSFLAMPLDGSDVVVDVSHHSATSQQLQQQLHRQQEQEEQVEQEDRELVQQLQGQAEPRTGVLFPGSYGGLSLAGIGVRVKKLLGLTEVNVYALGIYVNGEKAKRELSPKFGPDAAAQQEAMCKEVITSEKIDKTVRIVLTLSVTHAQFLGALEEKLAPPLRAAGASKLVDSFRKQFEGVSFSRGTDVTLSSSTHGHLTIKVNEEVKGVMHSLLLCRVLYSIWLGQDSVTPGARASFMATMEKLAQGLLSS